MSKWKLAMKQESDYGYISTQYIYADSITPLVHLIDLLKASDINNKGMGFSLEEVDEDDVP